MDTTHCEVPVWVTVRASAGNSSPFIVAVGANITTSAACERENQAKLRIVSFSPTNMLTATTSPVAGSAARATLTGASTSDAPAIRAAREYRDDARRILSGVVRINVGTPRLRVVDPAPRVGELFVHSACRGGVLGGPP
ncbi:MAG: hypothetical protein GXX86_01225 [Propionibacterium sp.]|nr:hypothetical protein [Propionibacterium sp.]